MDPKKVITLFVALAFVAIILGFAVTWYESQFHDGEFNYSEGVEATQFEGKTLPIVPAESGNKFYIVEVTLKNDAVDGGISAAQLIWKVKVDGKGYNMNPAMTFEHKNGPELKQSFAKGSTVKYTIVFVIPENAIVGHPELKYNYLSKDILLDLRHNPDLTINDILLSADTSRLVPARVQ